MIIGKRLGIAPGASSTSAPSWRCPSGALCGEDESSTRSSAAAVSDILNGVPAMHLHLCASHLMSGTVLTRARALITEPSIRATKFWSLPQARPMKTPFLHLGSNDDRRLAGTYHRTLSPNSAILSRDVRPWSRWYGVKPSSPGWNIVRRYAAWWVNQ